MTQEQQERPADDERSDAETTRSRTPTLADDPGLEHDHALAEGVPMTAAGSAGATSRRPRGEHRAGTDLDDDPGLEHDAATAQGRMMTGEGSDPRRREPRERR